MAEKIRNILIGLSGIAIVCLSAWLSFNYFKGRAATDTYGTTAILSTQTTTQATEPETTIQEEPTFTTTLPTTQQTTKKTTITTTTRPTTTAPSTTDPNVVIVDGSGNQIGGGQNQLPSALWQRRFGYTDAYDMAAPAVLMFFDTEKVLFHYDGLDWRIQFWKGQYNIYLGSEIGVYHKPESRTLKFYDCATDENMLKMEMALYIYENGEVKRLFKRPYAEYWWVTGFIEGRLPRVEGGTGHRTYDQSVLIMTGKITLKDQEMYKAFKAELEKIKAIKITKTYGTTVEFTW